MFKLTSSEFSVKKKRENQNFNLFEPYEPEFGIEICTLILSEKIELLLNL